MDYPSSSWWRRDGVDGVGGANGETPTVFPLSILAKLLCFVFSSVEGCPLATPHMASYSRKIKLQKFYINLMLAGP
jgi:hypothetical protein